MLARVLSACDCAFSVQCADDEIARLVDTAFAGLLISSTSPMPPSASYRIERADSGLAFRVRGEDGNEHGLDTADDLLYHLDKLLTIALQRRRPDLYFLHAAAVAAGDRVAVLPALPGTGKSTLTLALLDAGLTYLSDELAPVDVERLVVHPYARALGLKSPPPEPLRLPHGTISTSGRLHVPPSGFPGDTASEPRRLAAIFFLQRPSRSSQAPSRRVSAAAAAALLIANALNALAHEDDGLRAAVELGRTVPCFEIDIGDLRRAAAEIAAVLAAPSGVEPA